MAQQALPSLAPPPASIKQTLPLPTFRATPPPTSTEHGGFAAPVKRVCTRLRAVAQSFTANRQKFLAGTVGKR
jgi:hypothetical protein